MNKLVSVIGVILALSCTYAMAGKEGRTLEEFLTQQQEKMEANGKEFTEKVKNNKINFFNKVDTDKDGKITSKEIKAYNENKKKQ